MFFPWIKLTRSLKVYTRIGIPMLKIRRSWDRLIFHMWIPIPWKDGHYIKTGPWKPLISRESQPTTVDTSWQCLWATATEKIRQSNKDNMQATTNSSNQSCSKQSQIKCKKKENNHQMHVSGCAGGWFNDNHLVLSVQPFPLWIDTLDCLMFITGTPRQIGQNIGRACRAPAN